MTVAVVDAVDAAADDVAAVAVAADLMATRTKAPS